MIQSHFSIHGRLHTYFVTYLMEMFGAIFFGEVAVFFWFDMRILNQHANDFQIFDLSSQLLYLLLKYELHFVEKIFFWYFSKVVQLFMSFIYIYNLGTKLSLRPKIWPSKFLWQHNGPDCQCLFRKIVACYFSRKY